MENHVDRHGPLQAWAKALQSYNNASIMKYLNTKSALDEVYASFFVGFDCALEFISRLQRSGSNSCCRKMAFA
jgi:hypothetical protein